MTKDLIVLTTTLLKLSAILVFASGCLGLFIGLVVRAFKLGMGVMV